MPPERDEHGRFVSAGTPAPEGEWLSGGIQTPNGLYNPTSDDIVTEIKAAARFAGLSRFKLFLNGTQVLKPEDLPCTKLSELINLATVEGVEASAVVERYDRAG